MINREIFYKIEKNILYLYCLMFFINYEILKLFLIPMLLIVFLRKIIFGESLDCGNVKLKNFLLIFLISGLIWNFLADFNYRASRSFFKLSREMILPFYIFPIVSKEKGVIKNVIKVLLLSLFLMSGKTIVNYITENPKDGATGFGWVGTTRAMSLMATSMSLGWLLNKNSKIIKVVSFFIFLLSFGVMIISKSRAGVLALGVSVILSFLFYKVNLKKLLIMVVTIGLILLSVPTNRLEYFKTTFNSERTIKNASNGARIEMWKNALWRIKQHPVMGSGTKQDEKLFEEYVENMPEETKVDKFYKKYIQNGGFNDAHNMYLNMITDNGLFSVMHLILLLGILPYLAFINLKKEREKYKSLNLGVAISLSSLYIYGLFWSVWRGDWTRTEFWFLLSLLCCVSFIDQNNIILGEENENISSKI